MPSSKNALLAFRFAAAEAGSKEARAIGLAIAHYLDHCHPYEIEVLSSFVERLESHLKALEAERAPT